MRILLALVLPVLFHSAALRADADRVVVLVRHAEKAATPADDPPLSAAGRARAAALADALGRARVDAIITTQFARTRETAEPLARARGLTALIVAGGGETAAHARQVAAAVRAQPVGSLVVVVGHSNTVPAIVGALGGPRLDDLCDDEYATLFTVVLPQDGEPRVIRSSYGAPDPPTADACARTMAPPRQNR